MPGEIVEVRPAAEIMATLKNGRTAASWSRRRCSKFSGKRYRVLARVSPHHRREQRAHAAAEDRLRHSRRARLQRPQHAQTPVLSAGPYHYWREAWLRRVGEVAQERERSQEKAA